MEHGYILSIKVSGIKNIEKPVELNFYKKTVTSEFNPDKYRIKAIYGENGAGKSAIISSILIFQNVVIDENYLSDSDKQRFLDEIINKKTQAFSFSCEVLDENYKNDTICYDIYRYSFTLKRGKNNRFEIISEKLEKKSGNYAQSKYRRVFECANGELVFLDTTKKTMDVLNKTTMNLLSTRSFIPLFIDNYKKIISKDRTKLLPVGFFWLTTFCIKVFLANDDKHEIYFLRKKLNEESEKEETTDEFYKSFNKCLFLMTDVNEKRIHRDDFKSFEDRVKGLESFLKLFKQNLTKIEIETKDFGELLECELVLNYNGYKVNKEFESTGIRKLIQLYDCLVTASEGGIVFIDEMDSNLNDVYLCRLIEYFMYYGRGQLCFTTHNIDPMNVLQTNKNSIDFLSSDNQITPWVSVGNASAENYYKNGMIKNLPFNITASDFVGVLGDISDV